MAEKERQYIAIDLKSFYASVECVERKLDPLDACLVVADASRTDKTICLAVSPALKSIGLGGRPRLFEAKQKIREANRTRGHRGSSTSMRKLTENPDLAIDFITAQPRMSLYLDFSARIYGIYLRYIAPEDMHVYSVDEVFIDATDYLKLYRISAHDLAMRIIREVLAETGITATAGIGTNMYLCKIAMDIVAKKMAPDKDGVRIAGLDEMSYRRQLWNHTPLTDFWQVGRGTAEKLSRHGLFTMGDIARCSIDREWLLYRLFGVNAEILIDHAWGWEPVTMELVRSYRPMKRSISRGQILQSAYTVRKARNVIVEMADSISLELVDRNLVADQFVLSIGYDAGCLSDPGIRAGYHGAVTTDFYGRKIPAHAHGTVNTDTPTSSCRIITRKIAGLFDRIVNSDLLVRRMTISANNLTADPETQAGVQLNLFTDCDEQHQHNRTAPAILAKERRTQEVMIRIKKRFGKNAILKGINYTDGATQRCRNMQIGGHKA